MEAARVTLRGNLRQMPGAAWLLFAGTFVNRFGAFVLPFLILYLRHRGYSIAVSGLATAAYGLGGLGASFVGGQLADAMGRRAAITASMLGSAASMLLLSQVSSLGAIMTVTVAAGLTSEAYRPASSALIADLVPPGARVTAFALYRLAVNLGFAAGPALAGFLATRSFTLLFLGDAATSVVFAAIAMLALPSRPAAAATEPAVGPAGYRAVLGDRSFMVFLLVVLAGAFVYLQSLSTFALAVRSAGLSTAAYGFLLSLNGLLIIVVELPVSAVTQRLRPGRVMATGLVLQAIGFGTVGLALTLPALAATVLVWTLGETVGSPVQGAYIAGRAPLRLRGRYNGVVQVMWGLAGVLAPSLGAVLFAIAAHGLVLWMVCGLLDLAAAALVLRLPSPPAPAPAVASP